MEWRPSQPVGDLRQFTDEEKLAHYEDRVAEVAAERRMVDPPEAALERWIRWDETGPMWGECLTEFGYDSTYDPRPGISGGPNVQNAERFDKKHEDLAYFTCMTRFAIDPTYMQPPTRDQARVVYEYLAEAWLPCVRGLGNEVLDLPEQETFIEGYVAGDIWSPWPKGQGGGEAETSKNCHNPIPAVAAYFGTG